MNNEYEGIFEDATVADFMRTTSARIEIEQAGDHGREAFNQFVDEQLRAVRMAWIAADTYMQPLVLLVNDAQQRVFSADDDETLRQFMERMHREAVAMEARWVFIAQRTMVGILGDAIDAERDVDVSDPDEWQKAVAAGIVRLGVVWYAERREGNERHQRHGQMQDENGTLGEMREGARNQKIPLFASVLDR